ncbi:TonB-dependent receptor plug domain-containing protein [Pseudogemmobacter faecipullorum]
MNYSVSLIGRLALTGFILPALYSLPLSAQSTAQNTAQTPAGGEGFALGTIYLGDDDQGQGGSVSRTTGETAMQENRLTLEDALATQPGVSAISSGGGSRNEREIFVRGFDRWHVPLSIDGIRVFLPADNRLDYGRFLVPDLAEVQVQKSYVSVINGPGGMGGAINLVTRKPEKPFEGEARLGAEAGNRGDVTGRNGYLSFGTRQESWYAQISYMRRDSDGFYLSRDFAPNPAYPYQDEGLRRDSGTDDSRLNLKFGYTPNATDEYVLSYTRQEGSKSAPYSTRLPVSGFPGSGGGSTQRDWTWPEWDISSLAFYSHTALGTGTLKTRVYYNTFDNILSAWDDASHQVQSLGRAFNSVYDDHSVGASLEYGLTTGAHDLKFATHLRRDVHEETNYARPDHPTLSRIDPSERSIEETLSFAVEDTWRIRDDLRLVAGLSYESAEVKEAKRSSLSTGYAPLSVDALNWQMAVIQEAGNGGEYHASLSSRTAFPTLFHRYSTSFGTMVPNPDLKPERATNFELGYKGDLGPVAVEGALFYSEVRDLIQTIEISSSPTVLSQRQNLAKARYAGFEIAATADLTGTLALQVNYTWLDLSVKDPVTNGARITDIPQHKAYVKLDWQASEKLTLSPSLELYSSRWSDPAIGSGDRNNPIYSNMSGFALANLDGSWQASEQAALYFGIRNLFDRDYAVTEGFPEAGRNFYLTAQMKF